MFVLFSWLAGVLFIGYEIVKHNLWKTGIAAATDLLFVFWVFAGGKLVVDGLRYGFSGRGIPNQLRGAGSGPHEGRKTLNDPASAAPPPQNTGK